MLIGTRAPIVVEAIPILLGANYAQTKINTRLVANYIFMLEFPFSYR